MRLLAFGIHPDDVELGCGGTVAVHARAGHEVTVADLTRGESSSNGTPEERAREAERAAQILGCRERLNVGLPDAAVRSEDPDQARSVVEVIRSVRPNVVLVPNADDPHPDHASGGALVARSLYLAGIHGFDRSAPAWKVPAALVYSGRRQVRPDVVVDVTGVYDVKRRAIEAHASQFAAQEEALPTPLNAPGFLSVVEARDRHVGYLAGVEYGEAFQLVEPACVSDFTVLLERGRGR
jgi:bacillithiol biosynthesis deacetylase BshB1